MEENKMDKEEYEDITGIKYVARRIKELLKDRE